MSLKKHSYECGTTVVEIAVEESNRAAKQKFEVDEHSMREGRSKKEELKQHSPKRNSFQMRKKCSFLWCTCIGRRVGGMDAYFLMPRCSQHYRPCANTFHCCLTRHIQAPQSFVHIDNGREWNMLTKEMLTNVHDESYNLRQQLSWQSLDKCCVTKTCEFALFQKLLQPSTAHTRLTLNMTLTLIAYSCL